jgi:two-component system, NarL family, response regulator NreC
MTSEPRVRVLVVDDHTIVRQGLVALLSTVPDLEVIADCGTGLQAISLANKMRPDVVLLDLSLPDLNGVEVIHELAASLPSAKVVVLTMHADPTYARPALRAGAAGYLIKGSDIGDLITAIRKAVQGETHLSPVVASMLVDSPPSAPGEQLSVREEEVLRLVAQGKTSREVGQLLEISPRTVDNHRRNIMEKLGVNDVVSLTKAAIKAGLVIPE